MTRFRKFLRRSRIWFLGAKRIERILPSACVRPADIWKVCYWGGVPYRLTHYEDRADNQVYVVYTELP